MCGCNVVLVVNLASRCWLSVEFISIPRGNALYVIVWIMLGCVRFTHNCVSVANFLMFIKLAVDTALVKYRRSWARSNRSCCIRCRRIRYGLRLAKRCWRCLRQCQRGILCCALSAPLPSFISNWNFLGYFYGICRTTSRSA